MTVIESWNTDGNFWDLNSQIKIPKVYNKLYTEDKSKNKSHSSQLMWALAFLCDFDSKYRQLPFDARKDLIAKDILKSPKFKWDTLKDQINGWDIFKSSAQRQMMEWERLINEKSIFMTTLKYNNIDTGKDIEKLLLSNDALYTSYEKIKAKLAQEGDGGILKGGAMESLLESGDM